MIYNFHHFYYWLKGGVYKVLFLFRAGGCDRLGTFYCPYEEYGGWKPVVWEIMRTIEEENDHEGL